MDEHLQHEGLLDELDANPLMQKINEKLERIFLAPLMDRYIWDPTGLGRRRSTFVQPSSNGVAQGTQLNRLVSATSSTTTFEGLPTHREAHESHRQAHEGAA